MRKTKNPPETVYKDKTGLVSIVFYPDDAQLFLEVGKQWHDTLFFFKVNINDFWSQIVEYMEAKKQRNESKTVIEQ